MTNKIIAGINSKEIKILLLGNVFYFCSFLNKIIFYDYFLKESKSPYNFCKFFKNNKKTKL